MTEREPIGEVVGRFDNSSNLLTLFTFKPYTREHIKCGTLLYATPREWQPLTDEEVKAAWSEIWYDLNNGKFAASDDPSRHTTVMFARAIEAKLREKNGL